MAPQVTPEIRSRCRHMLPAIIGLASNVRGGENPPFTIFDFAAMYPQFFIPPEEPEEPDGGNEGPTEPVPPTGPEELSGIIVVDALPIEPPEVQPVPVIPPVMMQIFLDLAHASIKYSRFREAWKFCMGLYIAHFITLYLETFVEPPAELDELAKAGQTGGLMSNKSVDGVSVGYDFSTVTDDMEGWGEYKATTYGLQLITFAQKFGRGGMYVR